MRIASSLGGAIWFVITMTMLAILYSQGCEFVALLAVKAELARGAPF